eukprot:gnl/TRDRNA2_/TRDRNA2_176209_c6_seq1.p1 gnl/TRDRNA2_/TRDRNA2_176209_c6~~gnl/TRDRNA2_/TRDRNA2_176209_c6_seq1.p1  ORF type:complete len:625 (+),score=181.81 gnl/TRDRNA2_/TRDRNA2_176209_c6_seq1:71-1945(+)
MPEAAADMAAAVQKAAEEKAANEKAAAEKVAAENKVAEEKAAAEKAVAQKAAAEKAAAEKAAAARKAAAERAALEEKAAAENAAYADDATAQAVARSAPEQVAADIVAETTSTAADGNHDAAASSLAGAGFPCRRCDINGTESAADEDEIVDIPRNTPDGQMLEELTKDRHWQALQGLQQLQSAERRSPPPEASCEVHLEFARARADELEARATLAEGRAEAAESVTGESEVKANLLARDAEERAAIAEWWVETNRSKAEKMARQLREAGGMIREERAEKVRSQEALAKVTALEREARAAIADAEQRAEAAEAKAAQAEARAMAVDADALARVAAAEKRALEAEASLAMQVEAAEARATKAAAASCAETYQLVNMETQFSCEAGGENSSASQCEIRLPSEPLVKPPATERVATRADDLARMTVTSTQRGALLEGVALISEQSLLLLQDMSMLAMAVIGMDTLAEQAGHDIKRLVALAARGMSSAGVWLYESFCAALPATWCSAAWGMTSRLLAGVATSVDGVLDQASEKLLWRRSGRDAFMPTRREAEAEISLRLLGDRLLVVLWLLVFAYGAVWRGFCCFILGRVVLGWLLAPPARAAAAAFEFLTCRGPCWKGAIRRDIYDL